MALKINDTTLQTAKDLNAAGDVAGAYRVLAEAGDNYAANALVVIEQIGDPESIFARIVQAHWDRVAPGQRETLFMSVGLLHQKQYLDLVQGDPRGKDENGEQLYLLANSERLEWSYRKALDARGLPPITTVDSLFSLIDYKLETSDEGIYAQVRAAGEGIEDVTWAWFLDPELEDGRIKYDSEIFLHDGIESPVCEIVATAAYLVFAKLDIAAAGGLIGFLVEAFGEVAPQFFGFEDPESSALLSSLLLTLDENLTDDKLFRLLDAISLGDNAHDDPRGYGLEWLTRNLYKALHGAELGVLADKEAVYSAAVNLISEISADPQIDYQFTLISEMTAAELETACKADTDRGRAYRYALVNLQPFLLTHAQTGALAPDALSAVYDRTAYTDQYIKDRAVFLKTLNTYYTADAIVRDHNLIEFWDRETGESVTQFSTTDHYSQRYIFGGSENDTIKGGVDNDHLYGGAGDDKLTGLGGSDYMEGDDTYIAGDGDIIYDTDGFGRVVFGDIVLFGGVSSGNSNTYQSRDGKATYKLVDHTLTVTGDSGTLTIQNFNNHDMRIALENAPPAPKIEPIGLKEGNTSTITLNLDQSASDNGAVYELIVSDPDLLTLSVDGVDFLYAA